MTPASEPFDPAAYFNQEVAARYDEGIRLSCPSYDALHQMMVPWLQDLPPAANFLSAGAGTGAEILTLAQRFAGWRFAGVDLSAHMLGQCQRRVDAAGLTSRVELFNGRLQDYRPSARFDAASSIFVGHFVRGREAKLAYLRSIAAHLKPGGLLVLADLYGDRRSADFVRLFKAWMLRYIAQGVVGEKLAQDVAHIFNNVDFATEPELLSLLSEAGFEQPLRFYQAYLFGAWVAVWRG